jgi:hypothetical protein
VAHAATYNIYDATSLQPTYQLLTSGVTTTSYTESSLIASNITFKVTAVVSSWESAQSPASNAHSVTLVLCT